MHIFADIKTAVKLTGEVRKARKAGASAVQLLSLYLIPVIKPKPAYLNTIEGCMTWNLGRDIHQAVSEVFYSLPYDVQRRLEFTPNEPGAWIERARFWQGQLMPALPPKMCHVVMMKFIGWYAHCLRMRKETAA